MLNLHSAVPRVSTPGTSTSSLHSIDWRAPWLAPYATTPVGARLNAALRAGQGVVHGLSAAAHPYHTTRTAPEPRTAAARRPNLPAFVPQDQLPVGQSYEGFIRQHWAVPTREHAHDLFNGLIWMHWPRSKAQLNALQSAEIERLGIQGRRGPVRDACTVFDENGAILLAPAALHDALIARDWMRLFWTLRPLWKQATCLIFGHALLEQLCSPRKPLCAHVLTLSLAHPSRTEISAISPELMDQQLAAALSASSMQPKPLTPLPVLGIPGWCADNASRAFYEDTSVFRPPRRT
ncbi:DUF3025 domain-containing protein [Lampropedia puyangensis]|uniref:DUF3025 domain-containing protein n=1 Tax=Lampropedia puyangensis TaxID=1330072 RepID=A0A4S8F9X8_9BURK|nr:DUF3025 domain-containing protein [Lampropedia puyangensis]THU03781.1 DUF3025 domain-containing protein [Lampropedia puyangensis]